MDSYIYELESRLNKENDNIKKIDLINELSWELRRTDTQKSKALYTEAFNMSVNINYENGIAESNLCKAVHEGYLGANLEFLKSSEEALNIFEKLNNVNGQIRALNCIGYVNDMLGIYHKGLECYLKALPLAKTTNNINMIIFLLNNIGEVYNVYLNDYEEALKYFFEAIEYCKQRYTSSISIIFNSIGDTYIKSDNLPKALEYCEKGLKESQKFKDKISEARCYKNLGRIYYRVGNYEKSLENLNCSLDVCKETGNKFGEAEALIELGTFYSTIEEYSHALDSFKRAYLFTKTINAGSLLVIIHFNLANIFEKTNNIKQAVYNYKEYIRLKEELTTSELEKKLSTLTVQTKIKQAEMDSEIHKLKNVELKEKSQEISRKAQQLEESYKNVAVISEIGQKITASLDIETIMSTIYENLNTLMDATIFGIGIYDVVNNLIDYRMFIENSKRIPRFITTLDYENSIAAKCILDKKEIVMLDLKQESKTFYIPDDSIDVNETPPGSLIYYPLIIEDTVIGVITVQSYKIYAYSNHDLNTLKALASYIAIAINNSHKSDELKKTAEELQTTLENLQEAQEYLINTEKMAALGQLISGIAHEINTPLGAIQASISNISEYMEHTIGEKIPQIFNILDSTTQDLFFNMLKLSLIKDIATSSREERTYKKILNEKLKNLHIANYDIIADTMVDMGIYDPLDNFTPLLLHPKCLFIIQTCYELSGILRNIKNMNLAVGKASKMLYALKSYSHYNHNETPTETDIIDEIDTVLALYQNNLKQGTDLIKDYNPIPKIKCHPDELNQVWTNLIHNALQAMDYKGTLKISTAVDIDEDYVVVKISDTGKGIDADIRDKIFDPFFTTKRQGEGSGLGLDLVRKIVNKHNGVISVESVPGDTTFTIKLPINTESTTNIK
jgi:two-component system, NtrC family, sensor kinase